jgi:hypothetical protein
MASSSLLALAALWGNREAILTCSPSFYCWQREKLKQRSRWNGVGRPVCTQCILKARVLERKFFFPSQENTEQIAFVKQDQKVLGREQI